MLYNILKFYVHVPKSNTEDLYYKVNICSNTHVSYGVIYFCIELDS